MKRFTLATAAASLLLLGAATAPAGAAKPAHHAAHRFSFLATVVRSSSSGLLVRNSKGAKLWFAASQISHASTSSHRRHHRSGSARHALRADDTQTTTTTTTPSVTINIVGLQPGVTVLITESVAANGDITITITLPPATGTTGGEQSASGVVDEVDDADFYLDPGDGNDLEFNMDPDALANLNLEQCDSVNVTYHQDAGVLIADTVDITGSSTAGDCAPTNDVDGTITQVSATAVAIQSDQGPMTFVVDSSDITDGFDVGDVVDVTYTQESSGTLDAGDVEYVEGDDSGIVTAVSANSLTIADSTTGEPDVFVADTGGIQLSTDAFTGISVGDDVDISFHTTAAGLVADSVTDSGPAGSGSGSGSGSGD
jgi:hypothetical protein